MHTEAIRLTPDESLAKHGFAIIEPLFDDIDSLFEPMAIEGAGARDLLKQSWCMDLARRLRTHDRISPLLPPDSVAVQCTFFQKSTGQNWLVPMHQDLSIPVRERVDDPSLGGWSDKDGTLFVQPPDEVLDQLVAVRLHIDACGLDDGPLRVVPGSHAAGRLSAAQTQMARQRSDETPCEVRKGGALVLKPLLLHASSKAAGQGRRRVLHFVFGPRRLPCGLTWQTSVE